MEKNSEPKKTFTHKVKRFLTKVVRSCNKEKTVSPRRVLGDLTFICQVMRLSSAQSRSRVQLVETPWAAACQGFLFITNTQSLPKLMSTDSVLVAQSCPTLCIPMDCSSPGSSVHEIFQAMILEWVAVSFSRGSSQPRDRTQVSCTAGRFFTD